MEIYCLSIVNMENILWSCTGLCIIRAIPLYSAHRNKLLSQIVANTFLPLGGSVFLSEVLGQIKIRSQRFRFNLTESQVKKLNINTQHFVIGL